MIAASITLECDADRRAHWQDILDHMSPYPLQAWNDTITFRPDAEHDVMDALTYQGGARNTGIMFTTTFDNISARTLPAYRIATCNTLDKGNMFYPQRFSGWQDSNDFGMMFVMAARAGYEPSRLIRGIKQWQPGPNGIVSQKRGGGIETAGIVEAINNLLLQSHDHVIRLFPNWDRSQDAEFKRLRAAGAFLVDAKYEAESGQIESIRIHSEQGHRCVVQNPSAGAGLQIVRADSHAQVAWHQSDDEYTFATEAGVSYLVLPAQRPAPARGAPVVTQHPADVTTAIPAPATFTVAATGERLRYQWQKNRAVISGANSPSYTTPETTLWDIGSEYRCVISNEFGEVQSSAAVLNPSKRSSTP
jgi:hypothetical protein